MSAAMEELNDNNWISVRGGTLEVPRQVHERRATRTAQLTEQASLAIVPTRHRC